MSMTELTIEKLMAYATNSLSESEAAAIAGRVAADPLISQQLARIQAVLKTLQRHHDTPASAHELHRAFAIAREHPRTASWLSRLQAVIANCIFDSRVQPALGLRGPASGTVSLAYETPAATIDLELTRSGEEAWELMGSVSFESGQAVSEIAIGLAGAETAEFVVKPNAQGVFTVRLAPNTYDMVLSAGTTVVRIADLKLS